MNTPTPRGGAAVVSGPVLLSLLILGFVLAFSVEAQEVEAPPFPDLEIPRGDALADPLDSLVVQALGSHPSIQAALARAQALEARVPQAGALPDPTLSFALMNLPLPDFDVSAEGMTMASLQLSQDLPPRGLRRAREESAEARVAVARAGVEVARWSVTTALREAYFELLLVEMAEDVHHQAHSVLEAFAASAEAAYTQGLAPQQDIFRAQTELASIEEHLAELRQRRSVALAGLNSLLGRDSRESVEVTMPRWAADLLEADPGPGVLTSYLTNPELGGGFPSLSQLQEEASRNHPELLLARGEGEAARREVEVARRDRRPGISVTGGYGMRSGRADLFSAGISLQLPVFRGRKQDQAIRESQFESEVEELGVASLERSLREEVARAHADLIRAREQMILLEEGVIPQARATVESSAAAYRQGQVDFVSLMEAYAVLFRNEIELAHLTAGLGQELARLEQAVGARIRRVEDR